MRSVGALCLLLGAAAAELRRLHSPSVVPNGWKVTDAAVDRSADVSVRVGVKREHTRALGDIVKKASTPGSPSFLRHLTWEEAGRIVAPPQERTDMVVSWLAKNGARDIAVHPHRDSVAAKFTVGQLEKVARGSFYQFTNVETGASLARMTSGVWVPRDIADAIDTFTGFHGFPLPPRKVASGSAPNAAGAVTPALINQVHGIPQVTKSGKQNIQAIAQFQGQYVKESDLTSFCNEYEPTGKSCKIAKFIGTNKEQAGIESMLDTEYIMGLGQGTETWVYSYPAIDFCADLLQWGSDVTANATFPYVVSISYGSQKIDFCDANTITRLSEDIQKMASMGVTVMISSGDDGSGHSTRQGTNTGKVSPSFPASIPYAVAVGSTYFVSGTTGEQEATTQFGSGGGFSYDYTVPDYQSSAVSAYLAKTTLPSSAYAYAKNGRGTPDVALLGEDFTVIVNGAKESVGGTSASSPSFAAIVTLLNEVCLAAGNRSLGFALPLFYQNPDAFTDITKGTSAIGGNVATKVWKAEAGWDAATGLGVPSFPKLQTAVETACKGAGPPVPPVPPSPPTPPTPPAGDCQSEFQKLCGSKTGVECLICTIDNEDDLKAHGCTDPESLCP